MVDYLDLTSTSMKTCSEDAKKGGGETYTLCLSLYDSPRRLDCPCPLLSTLIELCLCACDPAEASEEAGVRPLTRSPCAS